MEKSEIEISVVIPFYNEKAYLKEAIESVLYQTIEGIEIILIDDGSTDGSAQIARHYAKANSNIIYIRQDNSGQGIARNKGIEISRGRYIYFLDSDDFLEPDAMEQCYIHARNSKSDIVTFNSKVNKYDSSEFMMDYSNRNFSREDMTGKEYLHESLKDDKFYVPVWLYFYDLSFLRKCKLQFKPVVFEDKIFTMQICVENPKITYLNRTLHCRRIRELSTMTKKKNIKHLEGAYMNVVTSYEEYLKIKNDNLLKAEMLKFVRRNINIFIGILRSVENNTQKKKFKKKSHKFLLSHPKLFSLKQIIKLRLA